MLKKHRNLKKNKKKKKIDLIVGCEKNPVQLIFISEWLIRK